MKCMMAVEAQLCTLLLLAFLTLGTVTLTLAKVVKPSPPDEHTKLAIANCVFGNENKTVCFDKIGCFSTGGDFFNATQRPVNCLPDSPDTINIRYALYTRRNPSAPWLLNYTEDTVSQSPFQPTRTTRFIVHGFRDGGFSDWINMTAGELLRASDDNVIAVDWAGGSGFPYGQATANTRVVGAEIALFVSFLKNAFNVSLSRVHIIGHSLGAHIAGYAGERLDKIGRITGLDAANPYFEKMPTSVRLDYSDAKFVDAIHTDGVNIFKLGFGMPEPYAHLDFYPSDGKEQPGCDQSTTQSLITEALNDGVTDFVNCNHHRSVDLFINSINSTCPFVAHQCNNYDDFLDGTCIACGQDESDCGLMGYHATKYHSPAKNSLVSLFLTTGPRPPFCNYHYTVKVNLSVSSNVYGSRGDFYIKIYGDKADVLHTRLNSETLSLYPDTQYEFVIETPKLITPVSMAQFSWVHQFSIYDIFRRPSLDIGTIEVVPMDTMPESKRIADGRDLCTSIPRSLRPRSNAIFTPCISNVTVQKQEHV